MCRNPHGQVRSKTQGQNQAFMPDPSLIPSSLEQSQSAQICATHFDGTDSSSPIWLLQYYSR